jgi:HTH-type transcriptional regulator/antitoxin HipB
MTHDVSAFVRDARRRVGMTQADLASRAGVTRRWLSSLEGGKAHVDLGLVLATVEALAVELDAAIPQPGGTGPGDGVPDLDAILGDSLRPRDEDDRRGGAMLDDASTAWGPRTSRSGRYFRFSCLLNPICVHW